MFKAHRLILAACSKNFSDLFETTPSTGSCVIILEATSAENMSALLEFMYKGEVHVSQESLNSFLKAAESLQVKGLSTEHGRLAAEHSHSHDTHMDTSLHRRNHRNSASGGSTPSTPVHSGTTLSSMKQECDSIMHPSSTGMGIFSSYMPPYRPMHYEQQPRKRQQPQRSPFTEQEISRQSVLRDGSKGSAESASPGSKGYRWVSELYIFKYLNTNVVICFYSKDPPAVHHQQPPPKQTQWKQNAHLLSPGKRTNECFITCSIFYYIVFFCLADMKTTAHRAQALASETLLSHPNMPNVQIGMEVILRNMAAKRTRTTKIRM